ncbi:MAG: hypothetical protein JW751_29815 [Polyangiaceae bacterium]|nr:hypothetical protein [Polyangiaceae bacterium]
MPDNPESDLDAYARLMLALATVDADRAALLGGYGLDETRWDAIDEKWQTRLSEASEADGEEEGVPDFVIAYAAAFERAQVARASPAAITLEQFAEAARQLRKHGDVQRAVELAGISLAQFLEGNQQWTKRIVEDPELSARFRRLAGI